MSPEEVSARLQRLEAKQSACELVLSLLVHESGGATRAAVRHLAREILHGTHPSDLSGQQRDQMGTAILQLLQTGLPSDTFRVAERQALDRSKGPDRG